MRYQKFGNTYVVRMEIGDDIPVEIMRLARDEKILLASVSGIGATDSFRTGVFDLEKKAYDEKTYTGNHEITALCGNITTMNEQAYVHLHINCAGADGKIVGGHLLAARVSLTAEIIVHCAEGSVDRVRDEELKINILDI